MSYHTPVLLPQVIAGLAIKPDHWYIDATVGGGGYAVEILKNGGNVLGIDTDSEAIAYTRNRLMTDTPHFNEGRRWRLVQSNFRYLDTIVRQERLEKVSGILFDLGFSSHQIDTKERGMSFRFPEQPFDLRLNQQEGESASVLINRLSKEELYEILAKYGEEERSDTISDYLYRARRVKSFETIGDVIAVMEKVPKLPDRNGSLARVFQAFRIAVNDELGALKEGLAAAQTILATDGRLCVISFHSLEDRIVKQFFRNGSWRLVNSQIIIAEQSERMENRRSRSAKLRSGEKL